jgi:hypothetical protein
MLRSGSSPNKQDLNVKSVIFFLFILLLSLGPFDSFSPVTNV